MSNIKMKVTSEQSIKIQEICIEKGIYWNEGKEIIDVKYPCMLILENSYGKYLSMCDIEYYNTHSELEEVSANLFIISYGFSDIENTIKEFSLDGDYYYAIPKPIFERLKIEVKGEEN